MIRVSLKLALFRKQQKKCAFRKGCKMFLTLSPVSYIRLVALDKKRTGIQGVPLSKLEEITNDDPGIESIRTSAKVYLNNTSFLSALFAFSMLTIIAQTNPPSELPAESYVLTNATKILETHNTGRLRHDL
jgi:hypothetical protein